MPNGIVNGLLSKKGDKMKKSGMHKMPNGKMMKDSAMVKEKGTGEMYASKAAMRKHEKKESPMMEKSEYKRGGKVGKYAMGGTVMPGGGPAPRMVPGPNDFSMGPGGSLVRPGGGISGGPTPIGGGGGIRGGGRLGGPFKPGGGLRPVPVPSTRFKKGGEVKKTGNGVKRRGSGIALRGGGRAKGCM